MSATDEEVANAARRAMGTWLAWPDAARDGVPEVTNEQALRWLFGLPTRLASYAVADHKRETALDAIKDLASRANAHLARNIEP